MKVTKNDSLGVTINNPGDNRSNGKIRELIDATYDCCSDEFCFNKKNFKHDQVLVKCF